MKNLLIIIFCLSTLFSCNSGNVEIKYPNGLLMITGQTNKVGRDGDWFFFDRNGDTIQVDSYKDNRLLNTRFYKNGKVASENRFENNILFEKVIFKSDFEIVFYYSSEDVLRSKSFQRNKMPFGRYLQYHKNGTIEIFTEDVKNGVFNYFDSLGNHTYDIKVENYQHVDTLKFYNMTSR